MNKNEESFIGFLRKTAEENLVGSDSRHGGSQSEASPTSAPDRGVRLLPNLYHTDCLLFFFLVYFLVINLKAFLFWGSNLNFIDIVLINISSRFSLHLTTSGTTLQFISQWFFVQIDCSYIITNQQCTISTDVTLHILSIFTDAIFPKTCFWHELSVAENGRVGWSPTYTSSL